MMSGTITKEITKIQVYKSTHFASVDWDQAVFADGTTATLEHVGLRETPWAKAIRQWSNAEMAEFVAKFSPVVLPGLDSLHPVGYEFDAADLLPLEPRPIPPPAPAVPLGYLGPYDDDIRSLEGNEDL